jgi:hypothetical protein
MSAPSADFPALSASTSSSGYADGFGRRALVFDREDGTMLERLAVRAELCAFERSLRDRLDRLAAIDDERIAKPRSIERASDGTLVVLSEYVPGTRLSDLIDAVAQQGSVPGVDVALGFLLDILPALCGLHAGAGFAHGGISAGRTVLTPAGQVVVLDGIFGEALARLHYSRRRLWAEFGIAMPPGRGPARFDAASDVSQAVLSAVMLMLGRPVADREYPDEIPSLLVEVVDVAQIRGTTEFAAGLQRFLQRSLPLPGRRPYTSADDALIEARDLARGIGLEACRRAFMEFIEQDSGARAWNHQAADVDYSYDFDLDEQPAISNGDGDKVDPFEVSLDLDFDPNSTVIADAPVFDLDDPVDVPTAVPSVDIDIIEETVSAAGDADYSFGESSHDTTAFVPHDMVAEAEPTTAYEPPPVEDPAPARDDITTWQEESPLPDENALAEEPSEEALAPAFVEDVPSVESDEFDDLNDSTDFGEADLPSYDDGHLTPPAASVLESNLSRRRRKRSRSARSRKDKLRSIARPQPLAPATSKPPAAPSPIVPPAPAASAAAPPPPPPQPASAPPIAVAKASPSGWLVEPSRAASFEPVIPEQPPALAPPLARPIALAPPPPPIPVAPTPVSQVFAPQPVITPLPPALQPPPIPVQRPAITPAPQPAAPLKLKTDAPFGSPPKRPRPDPVEDLYSARPVHPEEPESAAFPWKIASAVVVVLMIVVIVGGRWYLHSRAADTKPPVAVDEPPAPVAAPAISPKMGRVQVETQPAGARVVLDGKPVGESPLKLDVPAGRHVLTLASASGSVRKTIRVEAGKTVTVDVPIFSGWVDVNAPIILDVSEDGKSIGTTEQNRLLLSPGRHVLTFSNRDLDYTLTQTVEVEPGEVERITIDPKGTANLNATPWAEVWVNGKKIGETPLANLQLPLGTHEVVFKHPQFGERRMTTTIRANAPVALSVDMSKQ